MKKSRIDSWPSLMTLVTNGDQLRSMALMMWSPFFGSIRNNQQLKHGTLFVSHWSTYEVLVYLNLTGYMNHKLHHCIAYVSVESEEEGIAHLGMLSGGFLTHMLSCRCQNQLSAVAVLLPSFVFPPTRKMSSFGWRGTDTTQWSETS